MRRTFINLLALSWLVIGCAHHAQAEIIISLGLYDVSRGHGISSYDSAAPDVILTSTRITNVGPFIGIDVRPSDGRLYAFTGSAIFVVDLETGTATRVSTLSSSLPADPQNGFDFNPVTDRLHYVTGLGLHRVINVDTGEVTTLPRIAYSNTIGSLISSPQTYGIAFTNSFPGATSTRLYGVENYGSSRLFTWTPSSPETAYLVGSLGVIYPLSPLGSSIGFDISGRTGVAYLAEVYSENIPRLRQLYTVNLETGAATPVGVIAAGAFGGAGLTVR